jgi:hypothetical protein
MKRRDLLHLLGCTALVLPIAARAQPSSPFVVGSLAVRALFSTNTTFPHTSTQHCKARGGYASAITASCRLVSAGNNQALPALAHELVARRPRVIIPFGDGAIRAAQAATTTIPIAA